MTMRGFSGMTEQEDSHDTQDQPARAHQANGPRPLASVKGAWRGRVHIAEDFKELPADIAAAFGAD